MKKNRRSKGKPVKRRLREEPPRSGWRRAIWEHNVGRYGLGPPPPPPPKILPEPKAQAASEPPVSKQPIDISKISPARRAEIEREARERAAEDQAIANMKAQAGAETFTKEENEDWQDWVKVELPAYKKALDRMVEEITEREFRRRYPGLAALEAKHGKKVIRTLEAAIAPTRGPRYGRNPPRRGKAWVKAIDWLREVDVIGALRKRALPAKRKQPAKRKAVKAKRRR